jgi:hypothetical protein
MRAMLCCLAICLCLSAAVAQDQTCLLRYKYTPGHTDTYQMTSSGVVPMDLTPGPETGIPAMGMDMALDMAMTMMQTVRNVAPDGSAQVEVRYPSMTIRTTLQPGGQPLNVLMTWDQGVLTNTINGAAQPADENQKKMAQMLAAVLKMTVTPTGKSTPDSETAKLMADLMSANGGMSMDVSRLSALTSALPEQPVKVGDTWAVQDTGVMGGASLAGNSTFKLAALEDFEGTPSARIEGEARLTLSGQMPPSTPMGIPVQTNITRLDIAMRFVNHFDLAKGNMLLTTMNLNQNMSLVISTGPAGAPQIHIPATIENAQMTIDVRRQ